MSGNGKGKSLNEAKAALARDEVVISMSIRLVRGIEIAAVVKGSGFDVIRIDLEHNAFSLETTSQICMAALAHGITPYVRVPTVSPEFVTRVLDGGALGIVFPHIRNADDAKRAVACVKYPPWGQRSAAASLPHFEFRDKPLRDVHAKLNDETTVIALLESKEGIDNAEEIAAVDGVDILSIGTNDLCADMQITDQLDHKLVEDAYMHTIAAARKHGKHCGVGGLASKSDLMARYVKAGARYVSLANDLSLLMGAASRRAQSARELFAEGTS